MNGTTIELDGGFRLPTLVQPDDPEAEQMVGNIQSQKQTMD